MISDMAPPALGPFDAVLTGRQAKVGNARSLARAAMNGSSLFCVGRSPRSLSHSRSFTGRPKPRGRA